MSGVIGWPRKRFVQCEYKFRPRDRAGVVVCDGFGGFSISVRLRLQGSRPRIKTSRMREEHHRTSGMRAQCGGALPPSRQAFFAHDGEDIRAELDFLESLSGEAPDSEVRRLSPIFEAVDAMSWRDELQFWPRPSAPQISGIIQICGEELHAMLRGLCRPRDALRKAQARADALIAPCEAKRVRPRRIAGA